MAFDPKETIKKFQNFIHIAESNKSDVVEIPINELRQFFNDFQILNRQAERSLKAIVN